jgi:hypothetical protein
MDMFEPCEYMRKAGITNPNCQDGINFCVENCPAPFCVLDSPHYKRKLKRKALQEKANQMFESGHDIGYIAAKLGKSIRQVQRYIGFSGDNS